MPDFYSPSKGTFFNNTLCEPPEDAILISIEAKDALMDAQASGKIIVPDQNGNPIAVAPPPEPLTVIQADLCTDIDAQAQAQRVKYVTDGGPQAATYMYKQSNAQAALAAQTADAGKTEAQLAAQYPYLANEIGITLDPTTSAPATNIYGVARAVMAVLNQWQPINLAIEQMRLKTKAAINAATTLAAAQAAKGGATWPGGS